MTAISSDLFKHIHAFLTLLPPASNVPKATFSPPTNLTYCSWFLFMGRCLPAALYNTDDVIRTVFLSLSLSPPLPPNFLVRRHQRQTVADRYVSTLTNPNK